MDNSQAMTPERRRSRNLAIGHDLRLRHRRATPSAQAARMCDALVAGKALHRNNSKNL